jgi:hypothetical protein
MWKATGIMQVSLADQKELFEQRIKNIEVRGRDDGRELFDLAKDLRAAAQNLHTMQKEQNLVNAYVGKTFEGVTNRLEAMQFEIKQHGEYIAENRGTVDALRDRIERIEDGE